MKNKQIAEIAYLTGKMGQLSFDDMDKAYEFYEKIHNDWSNNKDIQTEEERGYISAYAQRVLKDKYNQDTWYGYPGI